MSKCKTKHVERNPLMTGDPPQYQHGPQTRSFWSYRGRLIKVEEAGKRPKDFDPIQLHRGTRVELEHTDDRMLATEIAMDHLAEDPNYYKKLATIHNLSTRKLKNKLMR